MAKDHENDVTRLDFRQQPEDQQLEDQYETFEFVQAQITAAQAHQRHRNFWNYLGRFVVGLALGAGSIGGILALFGML
tara:strand:+ start:102 stop:335 length:234 start_codon:yes stop_codon:yes gene_type:complete